MLGKNLINESNVKLIFGLKLRQLRQDKRLMLTELSKLAGISVSYLNEIEKGKKFPKAHKIASLAEALGVSYDWLISLQMKQGLGPVSKLLQSKILHELPLDVFGINRAELLELLSAAPVKLNAFLSTLIEISRNYGLKIEDFYFSALRSYQEMQENYFEEIEIAVEQFIRTHNIDSSEPVPLSKLEEIARTQYEFQIMDDGLSAQPELQQLRAVLLPGKPSRLLLNKMLSETQKSFIIAREIGFQFLGIHERSNTSPPVQVDSFEQVLNNFKGSYFACALLLNKDVLIPKLHLFFTNRTFEPETLLSIIAEFKVSPEIFLHRLTNLLPRFFGIQELFFLRFSNENGTDNFELTKELHLSGLHDPHISMQHENYCRRWISINILKELSTQITVGSYDRPVCRAQRSKYIGTEKEYLIMSFARPSLNGSKINNSVSIGLSLSDAMKKKVRFWNDPAVPIRMVGETCERCPATDCQERKQVAFEFQKSQRIENMKIALRALASE
ncbi:MAG TPA: XRE family transcriptional regulator [Chryseosolibacter sp.]|nr:XRE family transcriptional regulator [Chryseosolibacter sp.]